MYNEIILERLNTLQNAGIVTNADAVGQVGNLGLGTVIKIYLRIENGVITDAKFKTFGGVFALVASDIVCDFLINSSIETALTIKDEDIVKRRDAEFEHAFVLNEHRITSVKISFVFRTDAAAARGQWRRVLPASGL